MNKEKAKRHLKSAYESLNFWREQYVYVYRNNEGINRLHMLNEVVYEINERKERISRLQRIVY